MLLPEFLIGLLLIGRDDSPGGINDGSQAVLVKKVLEILSDRKSVV